jgi:hypothetical protein
LKARRRRKIYRVFIVVAELKARRRRKFLIDSIVVAGRVWRIAGEIFERLYQMSGAVNAENLLGDVEDEAPAAASAWLDLVAWTMVLLSVKLFLRHDELNTLGFHSIMLPQVDIVQGDELVMGVTLEIAKNDEEAIPALVDPPLPFP